MYRRRLSDSLPPQDAELLAQIADNDAEIDSTMAILSQLLVEARRLQGAS